ncbi:MAG: acyl-CoA dehydratase activase-related protein [Propionibacteriaceae bacterium]|nr:acyl-CoA dehydratase activase-related protein [Propionibacteriaceae bacterium]
MQKTLALGLDVGSTTVKAVVLDDGEIVFSDYRRHNADVRGELSKLLRDVADAFPGDLVNIAMTGSAGLGLAKLLGITFIQEVIASTKAIETTVPDVDVIIELGGEDAKITYLHPVPEQRMNGTCAGGTGAFIDQMAVLLKTDAAGLDVLAEQYQNLYPIASRCGVFAKSDIQPLLNQGAPHADIAASVFQAVATQTIAGLACGHPIRGKVCFLGGPLHFLPQLRQAYRRALPAVDEFVTVPNAQLFVAYGAGLHASGPALSLQHLAAELEATTAFEIDTKTLRPLFADETQRQEFNSRHSKHSVETADLKSAVGSLFLGVDAGSTTIKSVVIDTAQRVLFSTYGSNEGDPLAAALEISRRLRSELPSQAWIGRACVTGYGENLVQAAIHADEGEIETMAHFRAAKRFAPEVTSVIDIGGQDMKFLRIRNQVVDSIAVNEACSSGCGSFLETFATTMNTSVKDFAAAGCTSQFPVDLGSRCTVFMNSSVKHAQKEGASLADISAGLSYSVVRNALYKVIKLREAGELGACVVVQGGTFLNDAVLRSFELLTGITAIRPNIAGLMGAYGAALTALKHYEPGAVSRFMSRDLDGFSAESQQKICQLCANHCKLTITTFDDDTRNVSGNRCERGASLDKDAVKSEIPNLYDYKYQRIFGYRRLSKAAATRGEIGIPRALGIYEDYPLWFTILTQLGFRVILSGRSSHELFETGMESIPAENVCYPAKLAHGHIEWLLDKGVDTIFFPCATYARREFADADNHYNCPIVAYYPQVLHKNVDRLRDDSIRYLDPFVNLDDPSDLAHKLTQAFADWGVSFEEIELAVNAGYAELDKVHADIRAAGDRALQYLRENKMRGIVLAGRPYHIDPEIHHGIPEMITKLGMGVLSEDALTFGLDQTHLARPIRVMDQWAYHSRLYEAAAQVRIADDLNLVQLNSFGCGLDAITTDQVQEILENAGDVYTVIKIDEVSNLGAATIRLRSLMAATAERPVSLDIDTTDPVAALYLPTTDRPRFMPDDKAQRTIFAPQLSPVHFRMLEPIFARAGYDVKVLEKATPADVECGLKYVNNDVCFPAIMVIGQLINAFETGVADPKRSAVALTQTGGMCRDSNYTGMLRKGLAHAGYAEVPVIALSTQGLETNPGFKISLPMLNRALQAMVIGDVLQAVLLRVRPYEVSEGGANALYQRWDAITREFFDGGYSPTFGGRLGYRRLLRELVREFDELPLLSIPRKPRVGIVGEILVKFQPDANNNVIQVIESEGCEAVVASLAGYFASAITTNVWRIENMGQGNRKDLRTTKIFGWIFEQYGKPANLALEKANGKFDIPVSIEMIRDYAADVIDIGTEAGEGWALVGEMVEFIHAGVPNIICCQPFACLPNHVIGRGVFAELRRQHPQANIVSIDYDPGASEVNQLNRIKLMAATAHANHQDPTHTSGDRLLADTSLPK